MITVMGQVFLVDTEGSGGRRRLIMRKKRSKGHGEVKNYVR